MKCQIITIGTEITRGELIDSNAAWIADQLTEFAIDVEEIVSIPDDLDLIAAQLTRLSRQSKLIITTGGLGPTTDDLTREAAALALGVELVTNQGCVQQIEHRFDQLGRKMAECNLRQAVLPVCAQALDNEIGTAPGFSFTLGLAQCFALPGVPSEMRAMFTRHIRPILKRNASGHTCQYHLRCYGRGESDIADRIERLSLGSDVQVGYRASFPEVEIKLLARSDESQQLAQQIADDARIKVKHELGEIVYGSKDDSFASSVGDFLRKQGWKIAIGESCTGGLIAKMLTDSAGSSDYLALGIVSYSNQAKSDVLGVDPALIETHGAVSRQVAEAMAVGARRRGRADIAVAVTGIAGPAGGCDEKPVGTTYFAVDCLGHLRSDHRCFNRDRRQNRIFAAYHALQLVRESVISTTE